MMKKRPPKGPSAPGKGENASSRQSQISHFPSSRSPRWKRSESHPVNIFTWLVFLRPFVVRGKQKEKKSRDEGRRKFEENLGT